MSLLGFEEDRCNLPLWHTHAISDQLSYYCTFVYKMYHLIVYRLPMKVLLKPTTMILIKKGEYFMTHDQLHT